MGSLIFWIDEEAIPLWNQIKQSNHGRARLFSNATITGALTVKCVFLMPWRSLQGFINFIFKFIQLLLLCHDYSCISKRTKTVDVTCKTKNKGSI
ncbi:Mobile element protein [Candidatus Enterovibrio altilux]|uniref:Mobile element protein n=1 Tax=Candidatus Enterovibrio altilux TaxID=1927128 RepID=A0A291B868_9GAMM|nr:Mobile element protein [Candidatus Enterovibrio luxaltus]